MVTWYGQHIRFEQGSCQFLRGGGRGGAFASKGWNLGVFFCAEQPGLAGWFNIHYLFFYFLFFLLPTLPYLANLGPFFSLYEEDGLLTRRRVPYSS